MPIHAIEHVRAIRDIRAKILQLQQRRLARAEEAEDRCPGQPTDLDALALAVHQAEIELHQAELALIQWEAAAAQAGAQLAQQIQALRPRH